ncbi:cytochrome b5 [Basidiobolus meristosporus CBS 931.73]|uniref:Cytochrome b5 n=1 Tax=Basidiobolus meristosporus CBS 931.73 TaxID=1314790 RepID=A0A1Y1ZAU8_9FUNG|nr:cytochrome b5 [Basidiobolus meristosporus CBS 931.73]|eukprot:ORY07127.1 cytochrome b5 [Basidiobolus meristosporus CBS 931.73]
MSKTISAEELTTHATKSDIWLAIDGKVYDVTKFLDEHPGGEEVILEQAGLDATEAFVDVGHSEDARNMLTDMLVGEMAAGDSPKKTIVPPVNSAPLRENEPSLASRLVLPISFAVLFMIYKTYF